LPLKRECFLASQGSRKNKNLHLHLCNKNQITIFRCKKKKAKKTQKKFMVYDQGLERAL
jgi:hypothetical protein